MHWKDCRKRRSVEVSYDLWIVNDRATLLRAYSLIVFAFLVGGNFFLVYTDMDKFCEGDNQLPRNSSTKRRKSRTILEYWNCEYGWHCSAFRLRWFGPVFFDDNLAIYSSLRKYLHILAPHELLNHYLETYQTTF